MEDSRDIPKTANSTEAERLAAEAAAEAGWRWPRVRMMAQSPDLQESTEVRQPKQPKKQRSAWAQVRRFISEVTEVLEDNGDPPYVTTVPALLPAEHPVMRNPAAWIVAGWVLLVAIDCAMSSTLMPRAVTWISAQPWTMESLVSGPLLWWADEALALIQLEVLSTAVALAQPFATQWWCFCLFLSVWLVFNNVDSHKSINERINGLFAHLMYFLVADMALLTVLGPQTLNKTTRSYDIATETSQLVSILLTPFADAVERQGQRARQLQQAASAVKNNEFGGHGVVLLATAVMYGGAGLWLRTWCGLRLRTTVALLAAHFVLRRNATASLVDYSTWVMAMHVIGLGALLAFREAAVAVQSMRAWYAAVVRERRRGGPLMMQTSAARHKARQGLSPQMGHLAGGGAYAHRVCFLCLGGHCERCLLSMEIWPTTSGSSEAHPPALPLEPPGEDEADPLSEVLPSSPTRPSAAPVVAAGRRRVRKHGRTTVVHTPAEPSPYSESHDALPALGLLNYASSAPASTPTRRGRLLDLWIICSVAHCPCRAVHGPGPSAFVSKSPSGRDSRANWRFAVPVGSMVGLAQYVAELRSLGLMRAVNPAAMVDTDDFAAYVFPYIFGRFAVPEHKGPTAAANALLASNRGSSGYTPASAPFLAAMPSDGSGLSAEQSRMSRILMASTPLSLARNADSSSTFRLSADSVRSEADGGCVLVSVAMTPVLAYLLLSHPKTAPTAAVCVPAALLSPTKANSDTPAISDAEAYLDYARVQIARSDVVVRVNGARWLYYEFGSLALNQPIAVRRLPTDNPQSLAISLSICGMRSEDLYVLIPSAKPAVPASPVVDKNQELVAEVEKEKARLAAVTQSLKRAKSEAPKRVAYWEAQLETVRKSLDRNSAADGKLESKRRHLELAVGALRTAVQTLAEEQSNNQSINHESPTTDNQVAVDALARLRAIETEARQLRDAHDHDIQVLDTDRAALVEKLSEVAQKTEPLERSLIDPLQRDLRDVSRRFLVSRNVESKLQAKLRKELWACNDLAKERPAVVEGAAGELTHELADLKKSIARERAEIKLLSNS